MKLWHVLALIVLAVASLGASCGELPPIVIPPIPPCEVCPEPSPSPTAQPTPEPTPTPTPSPEPTPVPSPSPEPTPTPKPTPVPTPVPTPPPSEDCSKYVKYPTAWNPLTCTLNNKQICGTPTNKPCGCNGDNCAFDMPVGAACHADSTPRYLATPSNPCWKTGATSGHCEYPIGSTCGSKTDWTFAPGVDGRAEADGYGARIKFPKAGDFKIRAARKDNAALGTTKTARVK